MKFPTTCVPVQYRDAHNYKTATVWRFPGEINDDELRRLSAALDEGEFFIPTQIGLQHLGHDSEWSFPDKEVDHVWHELDVDGITVVDGGPGNQPMSIREFVQAITAAAAAGWNDNKEVGE